jgi:colanic acid/amylovoran biosynthesis glycosyltransferase
MATTVPLMPDRLKLLVVASTFPGREGDGTPQFVKDLSMRLGKRFDTVVLVPRVPGAPELERLGDILVERFPYFPRRWEDLAHGAIMDNLGDRPLRWIQVPSFLLCEAYHLRRLIGRHQPDILHLHWILPQGASALAVARGVPWVVTTHGADVYAMRNRVSRFLRKAVLQRATVVTTVNADMRERLINDGAEPATTLVQRLGADVASMREFARDEVQVPGRILFVGRLVEKKGLTVLVDAVRKLPPHLEWSLEVVGDGPLRDELTAQAEGLPVAFLGAAGRADVARAYARCHVMVVPSIRASSGDQDGLPTVLLEAMGSGRAVVASDLPGINEAVRNGETGLLVPPNDPGPLAEAIVNVLTDNALCTRLADAGARSIDDFTVEACSRRFVEILETAALRRPK